MNEEIQREESIVYEVPELVELGEAETLTLGGTGCGTDGIDCQHAPSPSPF